MFKILDYLLFNDFVAKFKTSDPFSEVLLEQLISLKAGAVILITLNFEIFVLLYVIAIFSIN